MFFEGKNIFWGPHMSLSSVTCHLFKSIQKMTSKNRNHTYKRVFVYWWWLEIEDMERIFSDIARFVNKNGFIFIFFLGAQNLLSLKIPNSCANKFI